MSRLPISVFIIAVDEADRIARTITSVRDWVDEVLVIDSGSTDDTVKVSEAVGARVIYNPWPGYGQQKRFGEQQCKNNWLINLDADEVISPLLAKEIQNIFSSGTPAHQGYTMNIMEIFPGETRPSFFAHRVNAIRLYDRRFARFHNSTVHDTVHMEKGTAGACANIIEHYSSRGFTHSVAKINRYSSMQAENMLKKQGASPHFLLLRLLVEFPFGFLKAYILRGYCLKGAYGFINSMNYGFSRFIRIAKYWEGLRTSSRS